MFVLHETPAGYALFKVNNESVLNIEDSKQFHELTQNTDPNTIVSLDYLFKFERTDEAIEECQSINDGIMSKTLQKFLKATICKQENSELIVVDSNLSQSIKNKLTIETKYPSGTLLLDRFIRENINELIPEIAPKEMHSMELGLAHNWSSFKIKFSPEKIDTMIIQAVSLLDDLDKEINIYSMRVREWYGWHFPEMTKHVVDHSVYCQLVCKIGMRENCKNVDMSELVDPNVEEEIKNASIVSMGSEISQEDLENIQSLCQQTIEIVHYREQLFDYLKQRMNAIAPNLSILLGELVGARLIAHTGSLINLAKAPGSTIQILGAEKALFRSLKTKKKTPKYGLIFNASLIGQAPQKAKGQISRVIASKAALCARVDALSDVVDSAIGEKGKEMVEERLRIVDGKQQVKKDTISPASYNRKQEDVISSKKFFDNEKDSTLGKKKMEESESSSDSSSSSDDSSEEVKQKEEKKMEEEKKESSSDSSSSESSESSSDSSSDSEEEEEKKNRKRKLDKEVPEGKRK